MTQQNKLDNKLDLYNELKDLLINPRPPGQDGRIWSFCPCHPDGSKHGRPSLSLHPTIGINCFAGCDFNDIIKALRERGGVGPKVTDNPSPKEEEKLTKEYDYYSPDGTLVGQKARFETSGGKKRFAWRAPGSTGWSGRSGIRVEDMPLYRAREIAKTDIEQPVWFCEGEKAADACWEHGLIATTGGGGAAQRDFGTSLNLLRGRTVYLWPDNDVIGREYMSRLEARLRGIAAKTVYVTLGLSLPEKGDAWDYFMLGGTVEKLKSDIVTETVVEYISEDSLRVISPVKDIPYEFTFESITQAARSLEAKITVNVRNDKSNKRYSQRINIHSSSGRTELRRDLDAVFGKDANWTSALNVVFNTMESAWISMERAEDTYDIPVNTTDFMLVDPIVTAESPTIIFGDGGSAKSWISFYLALCVAMGEPFLGLQTPMVPTLVIDYEGTRTTFRRRMKRIAMGMGMDDIPPEAVYYWPARGIPIADQIEPLKNFIKERGIGFVIIDSIAPACGGEPEKADVAIKYFYALAHLGKVSTLSIAHITKDTKNESNTDKPLGCYSEDTEVLTKRGWVKHEDVTLDDDVSCFDLRTEELVWEKPTHLHKYKYEGDMIRFHYGKSLVDMLVTPNHRMVVKPSYKLPVGSDRKLLHPREWHFEEAGKLRNTNIVFPYGTKGDTGGVPGDKAFLRFLGYWLSEGSTSDFAPCLSQQADTIVAQKMKDVVSSMGYKYSVWEGKANGRDNEQNCMQLRVLGATKLGNMLIEKCGGKSWEKHIPVEMFDYDQESRRELFEALMEGDGHLNQPGSWRYTSTSKQLADDVQRLAISLGYSASIKWRAMAKPHHHDSYSVNIGSRKETEIRIARQKHIEPYNGNVYCLTVPTGSYVTRRNGSYGIAGNSTMYHNEARRTWFIKRVQEEESPEIDLGLYCKKVNDGVKPRDIAIHVRFNDPLGPVEFERGEFSDTPELQKTRPVEKIIYEIVGNKFMDVADVAYEVSSVLGRTVSEENVIAAVGRNKGLEYGLRAGHSQKQIWRRDRQQ